MAGEHCFDNYLSAQVLIPVLATNQFALAAMAKGLRMCDGEQPPDPENVDPRTLQGGDSFGMGEANYPFPQCHYGGQ